MSLFRVQEWYSTRVEEGRSITKDQLIGQRDQIIISSLEGYIVIIDPGRDLENRRETAIIVEKRLPHPILQVVAGRFLTTYSEHLLAVLHPKSLAFYRLNSADSESYTLDKIFEHKLPSGPAYNMCMGDSRHQFMQIFIQTLNCTVSVYQGETHLFDRQLVTSIHPGPVVYATISKCFYSTSGGFLSCYPFHSFTATAGTGSQHKRLNPEWSFNLGDTAVEALDMDISPVQPSLLILCKRVLYCMTHEGNLRFIIRLQVVATCIMSYKTTYDSVIQLCIGTSTKTLLFYRDSKMVWTTQLDFMPTSILPTSFSDAFYNMISVLSEDCKFIICFLGTEPSLFRMSLTEARFIDFDQRRKEIEQFEKQIKEHAQEDGSGGSTSSSGLEIQTSIEMDLASMAYEAVFENVPSATIAVKLISSSPNISLGVQGEAFFHCGYFTLTPGDYHNVPITVFVREQPARDSRFRLAASNSSGDCALHDSHLPLRLLCHETGSQRNAQIKLSIDSTGEAMTIAELYNDFDTDSHSSLGFQPIGSSTVVSVFSAGKNSRYRVQSDSSEFLFLVFDDLVRRLKKKQPNASLNCPVPLHLFVTAIAEHVDIEKRRAVELADVERVSIQMRQVETILLNKMKAERDENMTSINVLINYSYQELLTSMDKLKATEDQLERHKNETLKPLLNLMEITMQLSGIKVPFDGRILDGNEQTVAQLLAPLLGGATNTGGPLSRDVGSSELTRLLVTFCEQGGRLGGIIEEPNEEEEKKENQETNPLGQELVNLENGALGIGAKDL